MKSIQKLNVGYEFYLLWQLKKVLIKAAISRKIIKKKTIKRKNMRSLSQVAALAALAAYTNAVCTDSGSFVCADFPLESEVTTAVMTYAGGYDWTMLETTTGYLNKMFKFTADALGMQV